MFTACGTAGWLHGSGGCYSWVWSDNVLGFLWVGVAMGLMKAQQDHIWSRSKQNRSHMLVILTMYSSHILVILTMYSSHMLVILTMYSSHMLVILTMYS